MKRGLFLLPILLPACPFLACSRYNSAYVPQAPPCVREYNRTCKEYETALKRAHGKRSQDLDKARRECEGARRSCEATMQRENFNPPPELDPKTGIPMWKQ